MPTIEALNGCKTAAQCQEIAKGSAQEARAAAAAAEQPAENKTSAYNVADTKWHGSNYLTVQKSINLVCPLSLRAVIQELVVNSFNVF